MVANTCNPSCWGGSRSTKAQDWHGLRRGPYLRSEKKGLGCVAQVAEHSASLKPQYHKGGRELPVRIPLNDHLPFQKGVQGPGVPGKTEAHLLSSLGLLYQDPRMTSYYSPQRSPGHCPTVPSPGEALWLPSAPLQSGGHQDTTCQCYRQEPGYMEGRSGGLE
jgi:hypothetical protein